MAKKTLSDEQRSLLREQLRNSDLSFWVDRKKITEAKTELQKILGFEFSSREFKAARDEVCKWYLIVKRKQKSTNRTLSNVGWDQLNYHVRSLKDSLIGRTLKEAVEIVCTRCSCNATLLKGLTSKYKVWEKPRAIDED